MDKELCTGAGRQGHTQMAYDNIGFSPCGEYVSHASNKPCDLSGVVVEVLPETVCTCRTDYCPCGEFVSHKVSEACTAI